MLVINSIMRGGSIAIKDEEADAAELAIKAHVLVSQPEITADIPEGDALMRGMTDFVNLAEAPEDAVCSLVIDLMSYCEREKIDWAQDVMARARRYRRMDHAGEVRQA